MAKKPQTNDAAGVTAEESTKVNLASLLSKKATFSHFNIWLVGDTPLITHAWSFKAKHEMLQKQVKAIKGAGKEERKPEQDFVDSLYDLGALEGTDKHAYGFPVTGVKNCILSAAHKDKGIPRDAVMRALWLDAEMHRVRPALAGAVCDMPLVRIWGSDPEMREDMVKIGAGLNKTANLAYRGQFTHWALRISGRFNTAVVSDEKLVFLIQEAGMGAGLGEWRNERKGVFGSFHLATPQEESEWEAFSLGTGLLPVAENYRMAAE